MVVGDPLQAQPVAAGGLAVWLDRTSPQAGFASRSLRSTAARPTRRARSPLMLSGPGDIEEPEIRDEVGWEHHYPDRGGQALGGHGRGRARRSRVYGSQAVAALAVTHADCEALADRILADLADKGVITGPVLEGPGWSGTGPHRPAMASCCITTLDLDDGRRVTNGSVATVTGVTRAGLVVTVEGRPGGGLLPAES